MIDAAKISSKTQAMWPTVECSGAPYELGLGHGSAAKDQIAGSIAFYATLFQKNARKDWVQVQDVARLFQASIARQWPRYHEEIAGIAAGSGRDVLDIVALNCRTELAFGLSQNESDGCTSLWCRTPSATLHGQNWDWNPAQKANLLHLVLRQPGRPTIQMVTEAGIIGKIGLNERGVGVTFNALQVPGMDPERLPAHLGLRMALEAESSQLGYTALQEAGGMGSCAFIMIGDANDATGIEFTSKTWVQQRPDQHGKLLHTNHCLFQHAGMEEKMLLKDSPDRLRRVETLLEITPRPTNAQFRRVFEDEAGTPNCINRRRRPGAELETLFNIIMDLTQRRAVVRVGRPTEPDHEFVVAFD